ncbi:MAG: NAD(+)/NADH kinase, partial [Nitrososphaerales archaeon]
MLSRLIIRNWEYCETSQYDQRNHQFASRRYQSEKINLFSSRRFLQKQGCFEKRKVTSYKTGRFVLKISRVAIISKEGHSEAKEVARNIAKTLLGKGISLTSFPNLHMKGVEHVARVNDVRTSKIDLVITVSGDGTILRMLRLLDSAVPCLCVNVGGRGIMAEIKPDQVNGAVDRMIRGDFHLERRARISSSFKRHTLPPALNEVFVLRQSVTRTPIFSIDFGNQAEFTQRMDGAFISTPTGSTGHSYSYGSPFMDGSLDVFMITPVGAITGFPTVVRNARSTLRLMATTALQLIIDGQDVFAVEANSYVE